MNPRDGESPGRPLWDAPITRTRPPSTRRVASSVGRVETDAGAKLRLAGLAGVSEDSWGFRTVSESFSHFWISGIASFEKNNACCLGARCRLNEVPNPTAVCDFVLVAFKSVAIVEPLREFALEAIYTPSVFTKRFSCQPVPSVDYCISTSCQSIIPALLRLAANEDDLEFSTLSWSTEHTVFGLAQAPSRGLATASPPGM